MLARCEGKRRRRARPPCAASAEVETEPFPLRRGRDEPQLRARPVAWSPDQGSDAFGGQSELSDEVASVFGGLTDGPASRERRLVPALVGRLQAAAVDVRADDER